jgi:hypothetical protein
VKSETQLLKPYITLQQTNLIGCGERPNQDWQNDPNEIYFEFRHVNVRFNLKNLDKLLTCLKKFSEPVWCI